MTSLFLFFVFFLSCNPKLRTLKSNKIPTEVGEYFSIAAKFDSSRFIQPAPFQYETNTYISIYTMEVSLVDGKIIGTLKEKIFPKDLPNMPTKGSKEKTFAISLKYVFCCSNHKPKDCVNSKQQRSDSASKRGCSGWKVIIL